VGRVLLGLTETGTILQGKPRPPWDRKDIREIESLIIDRAGDRSAVAGQLSILHEAARLWSAVARQHVPLPRFLPPERKLDNPFLGDYAAAASRCQKWESRIREWIDQLCIDGMSPGSRDLRMASFLASAILYGRVIGAPFLVALVRAIPAWKQRTFLIGRVHIEVSLSRRGVDDAEQRIWLPDALTAALWCRLEPTDADELLAPATRDGKSVRPPDYLVLRRLGKLIDRSRPLPDGSNLPGLTELRQSVRVITIVDCDPTFVAYNNAELHSESLRRNDAARLFPGEPLFEFARSADAEVICDTVPSDGRDPLGEPDWLDRLLAAAQSQSVRKSLSHLVGDPSAPAALRLLADCGVAMGSRTSRTGKRMPARKIASTVILLARMLGCVLKEQDLSELDPVARRAVYLQAINRQAVRQRPDAVQAIREYDLYLVALKQETSPVHRNSLPWLPKAISVDPNLVTHCEYADILGRIDAEWSVRSDQRTRTLVRLLIILAFRCGLRRHELRRLRMEDLLVLSLVLQVRRRRNDPLKTLNAQRRLPLRVLLTVDELRQLLDWAQRRADEGAQATDYLFGNPENKPVANSLFDAVNAFLRKVTPQAAGGKGIHLHHLRHAAGTWLCVALSCSDPRSRRSLFPALRETHEWIADGSAIRLAFYGNATPSRKWPFVTANFCGHGSFDTTASTYVNIFPWLVALALDRGEMLQPEPNLVRRASGAPPTTARTWHTQGGVRNISAQLLKRRGACVMHTLVVLSDRSAEILAETDWLTPAWRRLVRRGKGESVSDLTVGIQAEFVRADILQACVDDQGSSRHPMERLKKPDDPDARMILAAPLRPPQRKNTTSLVMQQTILGMRSADRELLQKGVKIFAEHHLRDGFVQFASTGASDDANQYVRFLIRLGFGVRGLHVVSGDHNPKSDHRKQWRRVLQEPGLVIQQCPSPGNYGPKSSLWIRPSAETLERGGSSAAGFRFVMAMAFIVFGAEQQGAFCTDGRT
jgi:integrase